jgi:hypothetical protein
MKGNIPLWQLCSARGNLPARVPDASGSGEAEPTHHSLAADWTAIRVGNAVGLNPTRIRVAYKTDFGP